MVHTSHGTLPVPAPAVVELLRGAPTYGTAIPLELTTPTGAALLAALCAGWGPMPAMEITASGFGAGSRELDGLPNAVQVVIGTAVDRSGVDPDHGQPVVVLEANVDDVTGEILGATVAALMRGRGPRRLGHAGHRQEGPAGPRGQRAGRPGRGRAGCARSWPTRPAPSASGPSRGSAGRPSGSSRRSRSRGYPVRVKTGPRRIKAEHDDAARVAGLLRLPSARWPAGPRRPPIACSTDGPGDGDGPSAGRRWGRPAAAPAG